MNYEWVLHTLYDEQAYRALAEASWQLFRRPKMQTQAYPILIAAAVMTLAAAFLGDRSNRLLAAVLLLFFVAAIPLSKVSAKSKMYRTAKKAAEAAGNFPAKVTFVFLEKEIHSTIGDKSHIIPYNKVSCFAEMGNWQFLFFDQTAAYIFNTTELRDTGKLERFEAMLTQKCGLSKIRLKGSAVKV